MYKSVICSVGHPRENHSALCSYIYSRPATPTPCCLPEWKDMEETETEHLPVSLVF